MKQKLFDTVWDYTKQAKFYKYRPNYPIRAIDVLASYVGAKAGFRVVDIGAGTGNLTKLLLKKGYFVTAVEPNESMMEIGILETKRFDRVRWVKANGTKTLLTSKSADWVTFGSSFNVMDRTKALQETHRLLKRGGYFTCLWNHRDLLDPVQKVTEDTIARYIPSYTRGVRREDQRPFLEAHPRLFKTIFSFELDFYVERTAEEYIDAWASVRNKYWDVTTEEGTELFQKIFKTIRKKLPETFSIKYTTRAWTAQKVG